MCDYMAYSPPVKTSSMLAQVILDRLGHDDGGEDDCITLIRCNGREFHIEMSPSFFCNSPIIASRYRIFIAAVRDESRLATEEEQGEDAEEVKVDFHAWLIAAFEPVFLAIAPDIPPSFDPEKVATGEAMPLLSQYLFLAVYRCRLEAENDKPIPIHVQQDEESPLFPPLNHINEDVAQELKLYVKFFSPSTIEVSFEDPEHALSGMPTRVLVDLDGSGVKTTCFFKSFTSSHYRGLEQQLEPYVQVLKSNLGNEVRVVRLLGVVTGSDGEKAAGLLLTYIDYRCEYDGILDGSILRTPIPLRERWASQVREIVEQLHQARIVWGDAAAYNVMVDKNNDAWLIHVGLVNRYTEGWVDKEKAGTKEGDLQGVGKIVEFLSSGEPYEPDMDSDWE